MGVAAQRSLICKVIHETQATGLWADLDLESAGTGEAELSKDAACCPPGALTKPPRLELRDFQPEEMFVLMAFAVAAICHNHDNLFKRYRKATQQWALSVLPYITRIPCKCNEPVTISNHLTLACIDFEIALHRLTKSPSFALENLSIRS